MVRVLQLLNAALYACARCADALTRRDAPVAGDEHAELRRRRQRFVGAAFHGL